jgi:hypothetical protein
MAGWFSEHSGTLGASAQGAQTQMRRLCSAADAPLPTSGLPSQVFCLVRKVASHGLHRALERR